MQTVVQEVMLVSVANWAAVEAWRSARVRARAEGAVLAELVLPEGVGEDWVDQAEYLKCLKLVEQSFTHEASCFLKMLGQYASSSAHGKEKGRRWSTWKMVIALKLRPYKAV